MKDMAFDDKGTTRAPLMIWDIAVNSKGIVYFTTYVQVRLEVKTLQRCIGVTTQEGKPSNSGSSVHTSTYLLSMSDDTIAQT